MIKMFGFAAILHLLFIETQGFDYCQLGKGDKKHILCEPSNLNQPPNCEGETHEQLELSRYSKKQFVDIHNKIRQQLIKGSLSLKYPVASYLRKMKWDRLLEISAQNAANTCEEFIEDELKEFRSFNSGEEKITASELYFIKKENDVMSYTEIIQDLLEKATANETNLLKGLSDLENISYLEKIKYAALFAKTYLIGCAERFWTPKNGRMITKIVCHYHPTGVVLNQPLYPVRATIKKTGFPCKKEKKKSLCIDDLPLLADGYYPPGEQTFGTTKSKSIEPTEDIMIPTFEEITENSSGSRFQISAFFVVFNIVLCKFIVYSEINETSLQCST